MDLNESDVIYFNVHFIDNKIRYFKCSSIKILRISFGILFIKSIPEKLCIDLE